MRDIAMTTKNHIHCGILMDQAKELTRDSVDKVEKKRLEANKAEKKRFEANKDKGHDEINTGKVQEEVSLSINKPQYENKGGHYDKKLCTEMSIYFIIMKSIPSIIHQNI